MYEENRFGTIVVNSKTRVAVRLEANRSTNKLSIPNGLPILDAHTQS